MSNTRLETLKSMLEQDPDNAFARYSLAVEYGNAGDPERAVEEFRTLLATHPDYVAGYYHGGRALEKLGRIEEARALYEAGIAASLRKGDAHARSELQAALEMLDLA